MSHADCQGCSEYLQLTRRQFMAAAGGTALAASAPAWLPRVALADDFCSTRDVLVYIFLRGGADGMSLCAPFGENEYYVRRPTLAIPPPDSGHPMAAIDLDGFFGFPKVFEPLMPAYQAGQLLVVHACGINDTSRSHFDMQRFAEVGKPADITLGSGWIGRHLASVPPMMPGSILRGVGVNYGLQQSLVGGPKSISVPKPEQYGLGGDTASLAARKVVLQQMYASVGDPLQTSAITSQQTIELLNSIDFNGYQPGGGAVYPSSSLGLSLRSTAALIKADVGVEAIAVDNLNSWDTHVSQGSIQGGMANSMATLASALAAFHADIYAGNGRNVTIIVQTEFGRRLQENGGMGTDHGHGGVMFVIGGNITGGRVLSHWPGLQPEQLFEGLDLAVTIDYRDVLAEIVQNRLGNPNLAFVFPDYTPKFEGVTAQCQATAGDMNCDGAVNVDDVSPFVGALIDRDAQQAESPACDVMRADVNADGQIDGRDVQQFTNKVLGM